MADLDFDLTVAADAQGGRRLTLRGELDLATAGTLEETLSKVRTPVVLDLKGLTFMDSTGVRVLLEAAERAGDRLRIIPPVDGDARVTIEETGIAALLPLVEDPEGQRCPPPSPPATPPSATRRPSPATRSTGGCRTGSRRT